MADRSTDSKVNPSNTDPDRPGDETVSGSVKNSSLFQDLLKDLGEVSRVHELMDILIRIDADSEDEGLKTLKLLLPHMDKQQLRELIRRGLESKHGPPIVPSTLSSPLTVEHTERAPSKRRPKGMKYTTKKMKVEMEAAQSQREGSEEAETDEDDDDDDDDRKPSSRKDD